MSLGIIFSLFCIVLDLGVPFTWELLLIVVASVLGGWMDQKFTCLAYSTTCVYLLDLVLVLSGVKQHPFELYYEKLIVLVGILHCIEGILTIRYGSKDNNYIIRYRENKIAGGYKAYRRWCIPLFFFTIKGIYIPILGVIVYGDYTFAMKVQDKARRMGFSILAYGIGLMLLGFLVERGVLPILLIVLVMPICHEFLFTVNKRYEKGRLLYTTSSKGIRIIEVQEDEENIAIFQRGDLILSVNNKETNDLETYRELIESAKVFYIRLQTVDGDYKRVYCTKATLDKVQIVLLPQII